jgi:hypothetical protein
MQQLIERFQKGEPMGSSGGTTPRDLVGVSLSGDLGETNDLVESLGLAADDGVDSDQMLRMFEDTGSIGSGMTPRGSHDAMSTDGRTPRSKNAAAVASAVAAIAAASLNAPAEPGKVSI